jgi:hypothetical protein
MRWCLDTCNVGGDDLGHVARHIVEGASFDVGSIDGEGHCRRRGEEGVEMLCCLLSQRSKCPSDGALTAIVYGMDLRSSGPNSRSEAEAYLVVLNEMVILMRRL